MASDLRGGRAHGRERFPSSRRSGAATLYGRFGSQSPIDRRDFVASADACLDHDATPWLDDVAVPTLVVGGTEDPFFAREEYRRTAASIPDARYAEIDAGHDAVLDRRREFDGAIRALYD